MHVHAEVCVAGIEEALAAVECGADRIELCTWPECGGTTPSAGMLEAVRHKVRVPIRVLVRATPGHFHYTMDEQETMLEEVRAIRRQASGLGIVIGALDAAGLPDTNFMERVLDLCTNVEVTFHRAIDHATDFQRALDICMDMGVQRVLTSGGHTRALDGSEVLAKAVRQAGDRLSVAAAGGIQADHVVELVERTHVREVHFAARRPVRTKVGGISMSADSGMNWETEADRSKVNAIVEALANAGMR